MLDVNDSGHLVLSNDGHGKERFECILRQVFEVFETRIIVCLARDREQPAFAGYPARQTFIQTKPHLADTEASGLVGGNQHQFTAFHPVDQARLAVEEIADKFNDLLQRVIEIHIARHQPADPLKNTQLLFGPLESLFKIP